MCGSIQRVEMKIGETKTNGYGCLSRSRGGFVAMVLPVAMICGIAHASGDPENIDDLGFNSVFDNNLFSSGFSLSTQSRSSIGLDNSGTLSTEFEAESVESQTVSRIKPLEDNLDSLTSEYQSQGLRIKRLSSSWKSESGTLTVGSDWANFQDTLNAERSFSGSTTERNRGVASQVRWHSPNGFSIAIEDEGDETDGNSNMDSPSVILSWQGGVGGNAGQYRVTAMGTRLDPDSSGQRINGDDILGWGLNLEGGWQIGDLFAALSVTYGKGINSYVLQRFGNEILVTPNDIDSYGDAYSIRPSLYYSLNENSNFHVALGHYSSEDDPVSGIDTLDTIHMGYSWSPWPSTRFGLELVGQNGDGPNVQDETQFKFGAQKLF